jgi:Domain of Unknown Function (DUF1521)
MQSASSFNTSNAFAFNSSYLQPSHPHSGGHADMQRQVASMSSQAYQHFADTSSQFGTSRFAGNRGNTSSSFSFVSQQSSRGSSTSSYVAASFTQSGRGRSADCFAQSRHDSRCERSDDKWNASGVTDGRASIDTGKYDLKFDEHDSSMQIKNKATGETTKVWGDPHLTLPTAQGSASMLFNNAMTFRLGDNTKITVDTKPGSGGVSYADKVTVSNGRNAYVVNGLSEQKKGDMTIERVRNASTPDGFTLDEKADGRGFVSAATGKAPTQAELKAAHA